MKRIYVLTKHPSDYPDDYVVRKHVFLRGGFFPVAGEPFMVEKNKQDIFDRMGRQKDLVFFPAAENDDPVIVGTWA